MRMCQLRAKEIGPWCDGVAGKECPTACFARPDRTRQKGKKGDITAPELDRARVMVVCLHCRLRKGSVYEGGSEESSTQNLVDTRRRVELLASRDWSVVVAPADKGERGGGEGKEGGKKNRLFFPRPPLQKGIRSASSCVEKTRDS